jgi:hypothetical protein
MQVKHNAFATQQCKTVFALTQLQTLHVWVHGAATLVMLSATFTGMSERKA